MALDFSTIGQLTLEEAQVLRGQCTSVTDLINLAKHRSGLVLSSNAESLHLLFSGGLPNGIERGVVLETMVMEKQGVDRLQNIVSIFDSKVAGLLGDGIFQMKLRDFIASELVGTPAFEAADSLVHGMTVVTRKLADFAPTGLSLINPWQVSM